MVNVNTTKCHSEIPTNMSGLISLPGIGLYAASVFLSLHKDVRAAIIDNNIVRVFSRFFGLEYDDETRRKWFIDFVEVMTPRKIHRNYNYALLDFARVICTKKPTCDICLLSRKCSCRNK